MGDEPALEPKTAIGSALRAIARHILDQAHGALVDAERSSQDAVHDFRRAMKRWRALMRLLADVLPDATRWRHEARDHARSLALARDGQAALNALDDLVNKGMVLSPRTSATIRERIEALRGGEERAVLTPELRNTIITWLETALSALPSWPLDELEFPAIAARLRLGYRNARRHLPGDWSQAGAEELHALRRRVVDHRHQMDLVEPLWPRFGRMWTKEAERLRDRLGKCQDLAVLERLTGPSQPLARWRSRLAPACAERRAGLTRRAGHIAGRLFAERPKAFGRRLESLWEQAS